MIPAGSKLLGETKKVEKLARPLASPSNDILMPDVIRQPSTNSRAPIRSVTRPPRPGNNHYLRIFGVSWRLERLGAATRAPFSCGRITPRVRPHAPGVLPRSTANIRVRNSRQILNILPTVNDPWGIASPTSHYLAGDLRVARSTTTTKCLPISRRQERRKENGSMKERLC